jgi:hypothetical protein
VERDALLFQEILNIAMEKAKIGRSQPKLAAQMTERETYLYKLLDQIDGLTHSRTCRIRVSFRRMLSPRTRPD